MMNMLVAAALAASMSVVAIETAVPESVATMPAQACQPVAGTRLEQFYPVMPGWTRGTPQSETDTEESVSRTTADFDRNIETISVELMDSCRNADVLLLLRETLKQFPPATRGTIQRHTTVNGFRRMRSSRPSPATARSMCWWPIASWSRSPRTRPTF